MGKRVYILLGILALAVLYSVISLLYFEDEFSASSYNNTIDNEANSASVASQSPSKSSQGTIYTNSTLAGQASSGNKTMLQNAVTKTNGAALPFNIRVVGISIATGDSQNQESIALIQYETELHRHTEQEFIGSSTLFLEKIETQHIVVLFENKTYEIQLEGTNVLADSFRTPEPTYDEFLAMSPEDIGSRPRILEHLVTIIPTPYIADGVLTAPGINPILFDQAGFKEDDVLKKINGKSVTKADELEEIKKNMLHASTLKFEVMRKGRIITLYLDIPGEALELTP